MTPETRPAPVAPRVLRGGDVSAVLTDGCELRDVRIAGELVAQRIYVAVRDVNWGTVAAEVTELSIEEEPERFGVHVRCEHRDGDVAFSWQGRFEGGRGALTAVMDGRALEAFRFNKIGFNVHHPLAENRGRPYRAWMRGTEVASGTLPDLIEPQYLRDGVLTALFEPFDELEIQAASGARVEFLFEGDLFEMQDHRNWTDANFKTYGTPLRDGYPRRADAGDAIAQRVEVRAASVRATAGPSARPVVVSVGQAGPLVPDVGVAAASDGVALDDRERAVLAALRPRHLRADVGPGPQDLDSLAAACGDALATGAALELALRASGDGNGTVLDAVPEGVPLARILVLPDRDDVSDAALVAAVRSRVNPDVPVFAGTDFSFAELNRHRPLFAGADGLTYAITPQVHAFDDQSLVQNLQAQEDTVRTARAWAGDVPIAIGAVTLRLRANPVAADPELEGRRALPPQVDPRQRTRFAAAWTLGSIAALTRAGVRSLTCFETAGWRGIQERSGGCPRPEAFGSVPGEVFPVWQVLADACELAGRRSRVCDVSDPEAVSAFVAEADEGMVLLLGNHGGEPVEVRVEGFRAPRSQRRLVAATEQRAASDPAGFRSSREPCDTEGEELLVLLEPHEYRRVDAARTEESP